MLLQLKNLPFPDGWTPEYSAEGETGLEIEKNHIDIPDEAYDAFYRAIGELEGMFYRLGSFWCVGKLTLDVHSGSCSLEGELGVYSDEDFRRTEDLVAKIYLHAGILSHAFQGAYVVVFDFTKTFKFVAP